MHLSAKHFIPVAKGTQMRAALLHRATKCETNETTDRSTDRTNSFHGNENRKAFSIQKRLKLHRTAMHRQTQAAVHSGARQIDALISCSLQSVDANKKIF